MMTGKQWIALQIKVENNLLAFTLSNSKPAIPAPVKNKTGIGLQNVKKRLSLLYPGKHKLEINCGESVYTVHMEIEL